MEINIIVFGKKIKKRRWDNKIFKWRKIYWKLD